MPCVRESSPHRCKLADPIYPFHACVARPVGEAEILRTPKAQEAEVKEWARLRDKHVWDEDKPREWRDV
eukprot:8130703-Alexandrium_andersonii.AAC.1